MPKTIFWSIFVYLQSGAKMPTQPTLITLPPMPFTTTTHLRTRIRLPKPKLLSNEASMKTGSQVFNDILRFSSISMAL